MRWVLWIVVLFALAVLAALGLGNNHGMVTVFWPPYRVDVSLTLALLALLTLVVLVHLAWVGVRGLTRLPHRARRWRFERKLGSAQQLALQALFHALGGRFVRADAIAQRSMGLVDELGNPTEALAGEAQWLAHLRWLNLWTQGECRQSLRDLRGRDRAIQAWHDTMDQHAPLQRTDIADATTLIRARWALDAREPAQALEVLDQLSKSAGHRSLTLRLRLKALRALGEHTDALRAARLLAKHGGFSSDASSRLLQSLALACLRACNEANELIQVWRSLDAQEQRMPEVVLCAADLGLQLGVELAWIQERHFRIWSNWMEQPDAFDEALQNDLIQSLLNAMTKGNSDAAWLERAEQAHVRWPRHAPLQALYGLVCQHHGLWGKAQAALEDALRRLPQGALKRQVHVTVAQQAESRSDAATALRHWKAAAQM